MVLGGALFFAARAAAAATAAGAGTWGGGAAAWPRGTAEAMTHTKHQPFFEGKEGGGVRFVWEILNYRRCVNSFKATQPPRPGSWVGDPPAGAAARWFDLIFEFFARVRSGSRLNLV